MLRKFVLASSVIAFTQMASAATWSFTNLTQSDVDGLAKEVSANTTPHLVLPPSSLGSIFGFELGIAAGVTKTPNIDTLAKRVDPTASVAQAPHGALIGAVTLPIALTIEGEFLPKISSGDVKYSQYGVGLKWTASDSLSISPINLALRGSYAHSDVDWKQTASGVDFTASSSTQVTSFQALVSPKLPIFEPYLGVGYATASSNLKADPNAPIAIFSDGTNQKASSPSSTEFILGIDTRFVLIGAGLEYMKSFGTDSYTLKLSLKF